MLPKDGITFSFVRDALRRRFWWLVIPFFLVSTGAVYYCAKAPRTYESSTLILIQPQEVPADYVRSTVTASATTRLATLKEQVMSRPKLEEIIEGYDLYPEVRESRTMHAAVDVMREHISVDIKESRRRSESEPASFEVTFKGSDPAKVKDVTTAIANLFIIDDLRFREKQAVGTSKFLEGELDRMRRDLREKEELVRQFKEENLGMLPEQMENNYRILAQLQQHLDSLNSTLQKAEDRKVLLQGQLARLKAIEASEVGVIAAGDQQELDESELTLDELKKRLIALRGRYTDKHPEVIRLEAMIEKAEGEAGSASGREPSRGRGIPRTNTENLVAAQREDLETQLALSRKEIQNLAEEKRQTQQQLADYKARIEKGPQIEQMFLDLRRDYQEAVENYQSLLQKKLEAELSENLERTQKGEQFTVLEPAYIPKSPVEPKVMKVLGLGFMLAVGCGLGLVYLREYSDSTFRRNQDLSSMIGLPVLVSIPEVRTPRERRLGYLKKTLAVGVLLSMAGVILYGFVLLIQKDPSALPIPIERLTGMRMQSERIVKSVFEQ